MENTNEKIMKKVKSIKIKLVILGIIFPLTIGLIVRGTKDGTLLDVLIMDYIRFKATNTGLSCMKVISFFGSKYFIGFMSIMIFIHFINKMKRRNAWLILISILSSYGLTKILKDLFFRTRPVDYFLIEQGGYSFPSGHSMISMCFYSMITYILLKNTKSNCLKGFVWAFNFSIVGLIGYSRLYLGVHWPTDVLAGYILGFIVFYICKSIVEK